MENCNEIFLEEIVHIELVPTSGCSMPVPFNIAEISQMNNCSIGSPTMTFDVNEGSTGMMTTPTLKTQEKAQAAGHIRNHTLQIPIQYGYDSIRAAKGSLAGVDFHAILRTVAGTEFLIYALPNTSVVSVDDQLGSESKQTVNVSIQSLSNMIRITRRN